MISRWPQVDKKVKINVVVLLLLLHKRHWNLSKGKISFPFYNNFKEMVCIRKTEHKLTAGG